MFESIRRAKLQREGLSCGKTRRKHQEGDLVDELRTHPAATVAVYVLFFAAIGVLMKFAASAVPGTVQPQVTAYLCVAAIGAALVVHLRVALKEEVADNTELLLVLGTLLLQLAASVAMMDFASQNSWSGALPILALPHALCPMVLSVILGRRIGLFGAIYSTLLGAMVFVAVNPVTYLACSSLIGFLMVLFTNHVRRRNKLFMAGLYVGAVAAVFSLVLHEASGAIDSATLGRILGVPFAVGVLTGLVVGGGMPVIESIFGVTTEVSWLEQADLNHPLMKRLSIEAPGTYHHSLVVANLSEAAAEAIGVNAGMTRVCAYFHDIGKLNKPEYFIENMDPAHNPHEDLTARMSALILIAHVKDGVDLAIKHKLNCSIIDVIEQHHGTSLAWYFYKRALDQKAQMLRLVEEGKSKEDDVPQVSEEVFRYPGPKPQFKEAAIISLADVVESASRALEKPNASRIEALVNELVQGRMVDGQLDECDLTIAELAKVKASFVKTLLSMMHSRIKYQKATEAPATASISTSKEPATGSYVHDGRTVAIQSPYLMGAENSGTEKEETPHAETTCVCRVTTELQLYNRQRRHKPGVAWLKKVIRAALPLCKAQARTSEAPLLHLDEIEFSIISDDEMTRVHTEFLDDPTPTDVITFHHGEILVSADTALRQGGEHGQSLDHELALYMIHGLMHLGGWDDHDAEEAAEMAQKQEDVLRQVIAAQSQQG